MAGVLRSNSCSQCCTSPAVSPAWDGGPGLRPNQSAAWHSAINNAKNLKRAYLNHDEDGNSDSQLTDIAIHSGNDVRDSLANGDQEPKKLFSAMPE